MVISCGQATRSALSFRHGARCWVVLFFVCGGASSREALSRPLPSAGQQNGVRSSGFPPGIRTFGAARCVHTVNDGVYRLCCRGTPSKHAPRTLNHFRSLPYQHRNLTRLSPPFTSLLPPEHLQPLETETVLRGLLAVLIHPIDYQRWCSPSLQSLAQASWPYESRVVDSL